MNSILAGENAVGIPINMVANAYAIEDAIDKDKITHCLWEYNSQNNILYLVNQVDREVVAAVDNALQLKN